MSTRLQDTCRQENTIKLDSKLSRTHQLIKLYAAHLEHKGQLCKEENKSIMQRRKQEKLKRKGTGLKKASNEHRWNFSRVS